MRGLGSRGIRPCIRQGSISISTSTLLAARRPHLPSAQRGHIPDNALPKLPARASSARPVVDTAYKEDDIRGRDQRHALVEQEIAQLQKSRPASYQHRSSRPRSLRHARPFTTSARRPNNVQPSLDPLDLEEEIEKGDKAATGASDSAPDEADGEATAGNAERSNRDNLAATQQRFERLNATRLAIQMMLQLRAGRAPQFRSPILVDPNSETNVQSLDYLIRELKKVDNMMSALKIHELSFDIELPRPYVRRRDELGQKLNEATLKFRNAEMHLPEYVMAYTKLIGEYKIGPPLPSYVKMMRTLSIVQQGGSPMAAQAEQAIWDMHQRLNSYAISNILYRYGTETESARLTEFLSRLTNANSWPRPVKPWFRTTVNGLQIHVPVSRSPHLICALVRAALCNQQQQVGEAYASVFFSRNKIEIYSGSFKWFIVSCFFESYAAWGSWEVGKRWLQTSAQWAQDFLEAGQDVLGRVILRMLDFCVACDQRLEYDYIMDAAVEYRLRLPDIAADKPPRITDRVAQIRLDWIRRARQTRQADEPLFRRVYPSDVEKFQRALLGRYDTEQALDAPKVSHPSESNWQDTHGRLMTYNPMIQDMGRLLKAREQRKRSTTQKAHDMARCGVEHPMDHAAETYTWSGQFRGLTDEAEEDSSQINDPELAERSYSHVENEEPIENEQEDSSPVFQSPFFANATAESSKPVDRIGTTTDLESEVQRLRRALADAETRLKEAQRHKRQQKTEHADEKFIYSPLVSAS